MFYRDLINLLVAPASKVLNNWFEVLLDFLQTSSKLYSVYNYCFILKNVYDLISSIWSLVSTVRGPEDDTCDRCRNWIHGDFHTAVMTFSKFVCLKHCTKQ